MTLLVEILADSFSFEKCLCPHSIKNKFAIPTRTTREIIRKISHVQDISDQCPTSKQAFFLSKSSIHFRVHNFTTYNRGKEGTNICGVDE
jgi:hypothetical protein